MVAIDWTKVVGSKTVEDGGYVGDLLKLALAHLTEVRDENQLTEEQVGEVYAATISTAINAAINYELQLPQVTATVESTEAQTSLTQEQIYSEKYQQQALLAKTEDEQGMKINAAGDDYSIQRGDDFIHTHELSKLRSEALMATENRKLMAAKAKEAEANVFVTAAKAKSDYGITPTIVGYSDLAGTTEVEADDPSAVLWGIKDFDAMNILDGGAGTSVIENTVPQTGHQAAMLKARVEANIGINTYLGYKSDAHYKSYKSLQELLFALGNAGVEQTDMQDDTGTSIYDRIVTGMEVHMNSQTKVWDDAATTVANGLVDLDGKTGTATDGSTPDGETD